MTGKAKLDLVFIWAPSSKQAVLEDDGVIVPVVRHITRIFSRKKSRWTLYRVNSKRSLRKVLDRHNNAESSGLWHRVFVLLGRGCGDGSIKMMNGGSISPELLKNIWSPKAPCDFIAAQSGGDGFAEACQSQKNVRWVSANPAIAFTSYDDNNQSDSITKCFMNFDGLYYHVELMTVMEKYMVEYSDMVPGDAPYVTTFIQLLRGVLKARLCSYRKLTLSRGGQSNLSWHHFLIPLLSLIVIMYCNLIL
jgi:hypothetical protein